ncbi:MAG TPA: alpha/beta hydrolase-fold protein [Polyangia bacterium]|jgi:enterochelin esterase family protein
MPGRVLTEIVDSEVLRDNALHDPTARRATIWLPPSYDRQPDRRYPVIYWLAGFTGTGEMLFQGSPWQPGLGERLDRLVDTGAMGEVIVVAPDCFTRLGGSQYLDSPSTGRYETHLTSELVPYIDHRFRTRAARDGRAVGGKSSGGYGALVLAMRHPTLFCALACHSGDAYFDLAVIPDIARTVRTLRKHGGVEGFLAYFAEAVSKGNDDITTVMMLAMGACYSPDASRPAGIALPFDLDTGEIDEAIWRRWKAWDPTEMVKVTPHATALAKLKLLFIDAGTRDEYGLDLGARILCRRLRDLGIAFEHQEFDDGHRSIPYRYDVSLPKLAAALGATPPP